MWFTSTKVAALEREWGIAHAVGEQLARENAELRARLTALQARYDRLVEQRLYRTGDINAPLSDPPKAPRSPLSAAFGNLGRLDQPPSPFREPATVSE